MSKLKNMYAQMHDDESYMNKVNPNPLSASGKRVMESMKKQYDGKKGEQVFYATMNKNKMKKKWEK